MNSGSAPITSVTSAGVSVTSKHWLDGPSAHPMVVLA
jgi:hypothetical protein